MARDVRKEIDDFVHQHRVVLFMKGNKLFPQCGFSARTVQALIACGQRFAYVDILSNPEIRANLPAYSDWPTFPQLFVNGELIGGCDIIMEMMHKNELAPIVKEAAAKKD